MYINTACLNEQYSRLWARRLAKSYEGMTHDAVALCTDRITKYSGNRDAAVRALGLDPRDVQERGPHAHLYDPPYLPPDAPTVESPSPLADPPVSPPAVEPSTVTPAPALEFTL